MRRPRPTVMTWICRITVLALMTCSLYSWISLMQRPRPLLHTELKPDMQGWLAAQTVPRPQSPIGVPLPESIEPMNPPETGFPYN
jgi:hypothetical protein